MKKKFLAMIFILVVAITISAHLPKQKEEIKEDFKMPVVKQKEDESIEEIEVVEKVEEIEKEIEQKVEVVVAKKKEVKEEVIDSRVIKKPQKGKVEIVKKPQGEGVKKVDDPKKDKPEMKEETVEEVESTQKAIIEKYTKQFTDLSGVFDGKIVRLLGEAKAEYNALSEKKKKRKKMSLGFKYLKKGKAIEKECDSNFDDILDEMEKELGAHGYSLDSVVAARSEYKRRKSERRKALMKKVLGK